MKKAKASWKSKTTIFAKNVLLKKITFFLNFSRSSRARAGPIWAHFSDLWFNFVCFGSKTEFLTKFLDDSAWFCVEKLKKHGFGTKNLKICPNILKILQNLKKYIKIQVFTRPGVA